MHWREKAEKGPKRSAHLRTGTILHNSEAGFQPNPNLLQDLTIMLLPAPK
jgi:hypothetical protein